MQQIFQWEHYKELLANDPKGHAIHVALIIGCILAHKLIKNPKKNHLGFSYWWYLINAFAVHWYLDGLVGLWGQVKSTYYLYYIMDPRYYRWDPIVFVVCQLEFWIMGPLCLATAILFKSDRHVLREVLAVVTSTFQWIGTVFYLYGAYYDGFKDNCAGASCFTFTGENLFFFWGACVFANPFWLVIPIKEIVKSIGRLESHFVRKIK